VLRTVSPFPQTPLLPHPHFSCIGGRGEEGRKLVRVDSPDYPGRNDDTQLSIKNLKVQVKATSCLGSAAGPGLGWVHLKISIRK